MQARAEAQKKAFNVLTSIVEKGPPNIRLLTNQNVTQTQTQQTTQTQLLATSTQAFTYKPPAFNFMDCTTASTQQPNSTKKPTQTKNKTKLQIEIDKYSQEQIKNIDPIDFWRQNKENYPGLFYCFTYIFTMQASSVPSESLFSEAGDQVTDKRNRLDPDRVNKIMVVEDYYKSRRV
jgi:hypothetical protein